MSRTYRQTYFRQRYCYRDWSKEFGYEWEYEDYYAGTRRPLTKAEHRKQLVYNYRDCGGRWKWSGNAEFRRRERRYIRHQENNELLKWRDIEDYEVQVGYIKHDWWD